MRERVDAEQSVPLCMSKCFSSGAKRHTQCINTFKCTNKQRSGDAGRCELARVWYNIYTRYDKGPSIQWLSLFLFEGGCHIKYDGSFMFWVHTQAERSDSELPGDSPRASLTFLLRGATASPKCHNSCIGASTLLMNQKMEYIASAAASQYKCFRGSAPRRTSSVWYKYLAMHTVSAQVWKWKLLSSTHPLLVFAPEQ